MMYEKMVIEIPKSYNIDNIDMIDFNNMRIDLIQLCHCVSLDTDLDSYIKIDTHHDCLEKAKSIVDYHIDNGNPDKVFNNYGMVDLNGVPVQVGDTVVYSMFNYLKNKPNFNTGVIQKLFQVYCQSDPSITANLVDVLDVSDGSVYQIGLNSIIKIGYKSSCVLNDTWKMFSISIGGLYTHAELIKYNLSIDDAHLVILIDGVNYYPVFQFNRDIADILSLITHNVSVVRKCNFFTKKIEMIGYDDKVSIIDVIDGGMNMVQYYYICALARNFGTNNLM